MTLIDFHSYFIAIFSQMYLANLQFSMMCSVDFPAVLHRTHRLGTIHPLRCKVGYDFIADQNWSHYMGFLFSNPIYEKSCFIVGGRNKKWSCEDFLVAYGTFYNSTIVGCWWCSSYNLLSLLSPLTRGHISYSKIYRDGDSQMPQIPETYDQVWRR